MKVPKYKSKEKSVKDISNENTLCPSTNQRNIELIQRLLEIPLEPKEININNGKSNYTTFINSKNPKIASKDLSTEFKDIEILNNIANQLTKKPVKKKPFLNKTASCENIRSLVNDKSLEIEIYNKLNNFNLKYKRNYQQTSSRSISEARSLSRSKSNSNNKNTHNPLRNLEHKNINISPVCNVQPNVKSTSLLKMQKEKNVIKFRSTKNELNHKQNRMESNPSSTGKPLNILNNDKFNNFIKNNSQNNNKENPSQEINGSNKKENCSFKNKDELVSCSASNDEYNSCFPSLIVKPKQPDIPYDIFVDMKIKGIIEEDEAVHDKYLEKIEVKSFNKSFDHKIAAKVKASLNQKFVNFSYNRNNSNLSQQSNSVLKKTKNHSHRKKVLAKSMSNFENEINKSALNYGTNSKSISINENSKKFHTHDQSNFSYELVKEYSHLQIDKEEAFMKRMLFDIFKRQTKSSRFEQIINEKKAKINETDKTMAFNRLIEDGNRRLEAQYKLNDLRNKIGFNSTNNPKRTSDKEWEEIYQKRFINYQKSRKNNLLARQIEKEQLENEKEIQIINNCKNLKKPKKLVEEFCNRLYQDAERRQKHKIKNHQLKKAYEKPPVTFDIKDSYNQKILPQLKRQNYLLSKSLIMSKTFEKTKIKQKYTFNNEFSTYHANVEAKAMNPKLNKSADNLEKNVSFESKNDKLVKSHIQNENVKKCAYDYPIKYKQTPINTTQQTELNKINETGKNENSNNHKKIPLVKSGSREQLFQLKHVTPKKESSYSQDLDKNLNYISKITNNEEKIQLEFQLPDEKRQTAMQNKSFNSNDGFRNMNRNVGAYERFNRSPIKAVDHLSNLFSVNIRDMRDITNNVFEIYDEHIIQEIPMPYKFKTKKPSYKVVPIEFSNTRMKYLPNHIAFGVVDNILNPKIHSE